MFLLLLVIALLLVIGISAVRGLIGLLTGADGGDEPDPMFAEPAVQITRPPELLDDADDAMSSPGSDASTGWIYEETSPVDKLPDELEVIE